MNDKPCSCCGETQNWNDAHYCMPEHLARHRQVRIEELEAENEKLQASLQEVHDALAVVHRFLNGETTMIDHQKIERVLSKRSPPQEDSHGS